MVILFGSNLDSCESFAETLASEAPLYGYNATVATLDSLPNDQPIIIITASYEGKPCENAINEEKLSIEIGNSKRNFGQITDFGILLQNKILVEANEIVPTIRHLEIKLPKGQTYRTSDYLAILPSNPIEIVYRGLKRFNLPTDTQVKILSFQLIIQLVHLIF